MEDAVSLRRSIWISSLITLVVLAIFVGISAVIPRPHDPLGLLSLGIILALVPAIVWMGFFNQQDRAEPEPKRLIARTFAFGALAAAAAAPFASQVADQTVDQFPNVVVRLILTVLSISLMQEVLKLAVVRYVVLGTPEFDRHPDGIVYGLASGLGFATILTIAFVVQAGGVIPLAGAIRAVDNALVHGVLGAVTGYYIGRVKIDGKRLPWLASGLAVVTVINGAYQTLQHELESRFAYNPFLDLAGAVVLAVVVGAVLFYFFRLAMRRAVGDLSTVSVQAHARDKDMPWDISVRYDWLLIGAFVLSLVVGLGSGIVTDNASQQYSGDLPLRFSFPSGWAVQGGEVGNFTIRDLAGQGLYKPTVTIESTKSQGDISLDLSAAQRAGDLGSARTYFSQLGERTPTQIGGQEALQMEYEYATQVDAGPVVVHGIESYVKLGDRIYIFRYEAEPGAFEQSLPLYQKLLNSVSPVGAK